MEIKIQRIGIESLENITILFNEYMIFYKKPSNILSHKTYLKERIKNNEATIFLALDKNDIPLGFVLNYYSFSSVSLGKTIILNDLFVLPKFRKNGIAEKLILHTFKLAKKIGAVKVDLGTAKDNFTAQKLYERIGFKRDEEFYNYSYKI